MDQGRYISLLWSIFLDWFIIYAVDKCAGSFVKINKNKPIIHRDLLYLFLTVADLHF
jgi:hypothetical protein